MGLSPDRASAAPTAGEPTQETITTTLYPGWNMVGWVGASTPPSEPFDAIPALQQVSAWDASHGRYRHAVRYGGGELPTVERGMGLWLRLRGDATVQWTRAVSDEALVLPLYAGPNLVAWAGEDTTPLDSALERLGGDVARSSQWNARSQRFEHYAPGALDGADTLSRLHRGDAIWVETSKARGWWQLGVSTPRISFYGDLPQGLRDDILDRYRALEGFFAERFAVLGSGVQIYVGSDADALRVTHLAIFGFVPREDICIRHTPAAVVISGSRCVEQFSLDQIARLYFRGLVPLNTDPPHLSLPEWLNAGSELYVLAQARHAPGSEDALRYRDGQVVGAAQTAVPLRELERGANPSEVTSRAVRGLSFLAVEWLAEHAGEPAIFEFFRRLPSSADWESAFERAFAISVEDFVGAFEEPRPSRRCHLAGDRSPRLLDDLAGPAAAIEAEFDLARATGPTDQRGS